MAENPLVHIPKAEVAFRRVNALRRRTVGRLQRFDVIRWPDVKYGTDIAQQMHIWELNDLAPRDGWPAVLLLHGGGWMEGSWRDFESFGPALSRRGAMVGGIDYRLAPDHRWPAALDDVLEAIAFFRDQQVDPDRIALWGHSAGGQLALMAALTRPDWVRCVVALGAPTDLRHDQGLSDQLELVFDDDQRMGASPLHMDCEQPPPMLLVHGSLDRQVPIHHAHAMRARHPEAVTLIEVTDGDHGLRWPLIDAYRARRRALRWLMAELSPARRPSKWKRRKKKKKKQ